MWTQVKGPVLERSGDPIPPPPIASSFGARVTLIIIIIIRDCASRTAPTASAGGWYLLAGHKSNATAEQLK